MSSTTTPTAGDSVLGDEHGGLLERPVSRRTTPSERARRRLRGRPELYTAYAQDMSLLNTPAKRNSVLAICAFALWMAFVLPNDLVVLFATAFALCIGAIGLNIVTGYAGQVSLGHAFFVGLGAYTGAILSGPTDGRLLGFGLTEIWIWLPAAGVVAAVAGLAVAPLALRLKGLYLAIVTLGLVFVGDHVFKEAKTLTGGAGVGRSAAVPSIGGVRLDLDGALFGVFLSKGQKLYLLAFLLLVIAAVIGRNLARSDLGRSFSAVRDRDIAAEVIGVNLTRAKVLAFGISSFYAGVCGALLFTITGFIEPGSLNLLLSVRFIAMILVGGVATISGSIMGALFIGTLGRVSRDLATQLPSAIALSPELLEALLYGVLIIGFLILEPRGLFGIWLRVRNYWKGWPFSY
ncbi:MAG: branched-chain amino acid ABC transporter permease [Actinomycetes bacterium]